MHDVLMCSNQVVPEVLIGAAYRYDCRHWYGEKYVGTCWNGHRCMGRVLEESVYLDGLLAYRTANDSDVTGIHFLVVLPVMCVHVNGFDATCRSFPGG